MHRAAPASRVDAGSRCWYGESTMPIPGRHLVRHAILAAVLVLVAGCGGEGGEDDGGPTKSPGSNCLSCHSPGGGAPAFSAAGTVFAGGNSTAGVAGATVTIRPSSGTVAVMTTNSVGNFYTSAPLNPPLTISVSAGGHTNTMASTASSGACGSCHKPSASGASARARVHVGACATCH
jgi:hypothetical protein